MIQTRTLLGPSDRQKLGNVGVQQMDYVSDHTYLCRYENQDLGNIRQMEALIEVDTYRTAFTITPSLTKAEPNERHEVDVVFNLGVDSKNSNLQALVSEKSNCPTKDIQFLSNKARLTMQGRDLDNVASIDGVRCIEEVGKVVPDNSTARRILRLDPPPATGSAPQPASSLTPQSASISAPQPVTGPAPHHIYLGKGQVIAVVDTGLDQGEHKPLHPAFTGRVIRWFGNNTADYNGHCTHVCGSALGDFANAVDGQVTRAAPQESLIFQSI